MVALLDQYGSATTIQVGTGQDPAFCNGMTTVKHENNESSSHNQVAPANSSLTATETAFGATLGTLALMVMIVVALLWAKLVKKGSKLRRVDLELEAARGSKSGDPGVIGDRGRIRSA